MAARFERWIARREKREPAQHITGTQGFYGLDFRVDRRVLIPRPETEGVVEAALALDLAPGARVVDLGTGSGCLAITLAVRRPDLSVDALDRSREALEVARDNAVRHGVSTRLRFTEASFDAPPAAWSGQIDLVVSNPPYVSQDEWETLQPEVRDHDPHQALVSGPTGLEAYVRLVPAARELLGHGGDLILELGHGQKSAVTDIVIAAGFRDIRVRDDFQQIPRILIAVAP
jgi:release factor glutamine methyltransferase